MAILETIAAANAAYGVIKQCLQNGKEVQGLVGEVGKFLGAEEELQEQYKKRQNNPFAKALGKDISDWEHFQHLEEIRQKREELESWCRLYAPAGTWDRWQQYQVEARRARKQARIAAEKAREQRIEVVAVGICILIFLGALGAIFWYIGKSRGLW